MRVGSVWPNLDQNIQLNHVLWFYLIDLKSIYNDSQWFKIDLYDSQWYPRKPEFRLLIENFCVLSVDAFILIIDLKNIVT